MTWLEADRRSMSEKKKGILFDLDGTLWDSAEGVALSWNRALERMGRPERLDVAGVHGVMGRTMDAIARAVFPHETQEEASRLLDVCILEENAYLLEHGGTLFEGLEETLKRLKAEGYFLAVVSNCQEGYIEAFTAYHRLERYFSDSENFGRTGCGKSHNIRLVVERNHLDAAVYVGDTQGDFDATMEAGLPFIHAAYGFGTVPAGTPAIEDIRDLPEKADEVLGGSGPHA